MGMAATLESYLRKHPAPFELLHHTHSATSLQSARTSHIPADRIAKAVMLEDDERCLLAVLPATSRVRLGELSAHTGRVMRLADEEELRRVFTDCESGAVPALGCAYGLETIWDNSLEDGPDIYFEAGDHETLVRMRTSDFVRMIGDRQRTHFADRPLMAASWIDENDWN